MPSRTRSSQTEQGRLPGRSAHFRELASHPDRHCSRLLAELPFEDRPVGLHDALDVRLASGAVGIQERDAV
jgi:hypothetical protein